MVVYIPEMSVRFRDRTSYVVADPNGCLSKREESEFCLRLTNTCLSPVVLPVLCELQDLRVSKLRVSSKTIK